jgi:hypothetical protein
MTGAPDPGAGVEHRRTAHAIVTAELARHAAEAGHERRLWMVAVPVHYRYNAHPVLGHVNVDEVLGVKADHRAQVEDWVRHWLGRAWSEILDYDEWWAQRRTWPDGCPKTWDVPPARHYTHPTAGRIVVWPDGSLEGYGPDGKRKHLNPAATAARLESGYGQWRETWFDHTGTEIKPAWVKAICKAAGVTYP